MDHLAVHQLFLPYPHQITLSLGQEVFPYTLQWTYQDLFPWHRDYLHYESLLSCDQFLAQTHQKDLKQDL